MYDKPANSGRRTRLALVVIVSACTALAHKLRFVQDDAFISFRYSENFARGNGLVWNIGERVDGYTSFLWTVLMAIPSAMGISIVTFSYVVGLTCFALSLLMLFGIAKRMVSANSALLVVLLTGLNYSFAIYATGGLETPLVAATWLACLYLSLPVLQGEEVRTIRLVALSLASAAALLTRLDSAVYLAVLQSPVLLILKFNRRGWKQRLALLVPELVIFGAWCGWQVWYYGDLMPNSYYLKIAGANGYVRLVNGTYFLLQFLLRFLFLPCLLLLFVHIRKLKTDKSLLTLLALAASWCGYVVYAGGDFMEYRFMVAIVPVLSILLVWAARRSVQWKVGTMTIGVALLAAVSPWAGIQIGPHHLKVETREELQSHLDADGQDWQGIGEMLSRVFDRDQTVSIAVFPAGAIPFYSGLPAVDMLGLNDPWVARHGWVVSRWPGHYRVAPLQYVLERRTALLILQPQIVPHSAPLLSNYSAAQVVVSEICDARCALPAGAKLLRIPVDGNRDLVVIYPFPNGAVDAAIGRNHWRVSPIVD